MTKKYVVVRIPKVAFDKLLYKKINMQKRIKCITGKEIRITNTKLFEFLSNKPIFAEDIELKKNFTSKTLRRFN